MKLFNLVTLTVLIIGGLNWGMVSWFGQDAVSLTLGADTLAGRLVYLTFALAAAYQVLPLWLACRIPEAEVQANRL